MSEWEERGQGPFWACTAQLRMPKWWGGKSEGKGALGPPQKGRVGEAQLRVRVGPQ